MRPLVIAHHLVWTAYGWWLPNDPRGSTSRTVVQPHIAALGAHHYGRQREQPPPAVIRQFQQRADAALAHPRLERFDIDVECVAAAFADAINAQTYTCYACAIMPDHVHLLMRKHRHTAETMVTVLQHASRGALIQAGHRSDSHPVWTSGHGWRGFLDHPDAVQRTIRYIRNNPVKMHRPEQRWDFVTTYDRWPLHPGHSEHSPYVKRLNAAGRSP
jgi:REP element-mobilizing transposase RayT